jgi:hypothetical protein
LGRGPERRPRLFPCTTRTRWRRGPDRHSPFERGPQPRDDSRRGVGDAREALVAFAEAYDVGVYAAFRRQDVFPNEHPLYLEPLTLGTPTETLQVLKAADLIFVIGSRLDEITTQS